MQSRIAACRAIPIPSVRAVTSPPGHHSFGYYDKSPWDRTGRYLLALRAGFCDRSPGPDDVATLGVVDLDNDNRFEAFAETRAWNWQQGCMLQWLPAADRFVVFNDRDGDHFVSLVCDAFTGRVVRRLPLPVYAINHAGDTGLTLNFSRLHTQRPGYGYAGVSDPWQDIGEPADDGIFRMDLQAGANRLIVSTAEIAQLLREPSMDGAIHRFNHLSFSPDDARFIFLHRWRPLANGSRPTLARRVRGAAGGLARLLTDDDDYTGLTLSRRIGAGLDGLKRVASRHYGAGEPGLTRLYTASVDGGEAALLADEGLVSHFDWRDDQHILAWARVGARDGFFLIDSRTGSATLVDPDRMPRDGHCSYSPDAARRFILNDTLPDRERLIDLYLYDAVTHRRLELGRFWSPPSFMNDFRCDLHPRWSRDGRQICFDSAHEGTRQLYVVDVPPIEDN
jgi:hypothetical protein